MKKLIIFILLFGFMIAESKTITLKHNCYAKTTSDWRTSDRKHKLLMSNTVLKVIGTYGDYYKVEIVEGADKKHTSDNVGQAGYMWSHCVNRDSSEVINEGVNLRTEPIKNASTQICGVKTGAKLRIIKLLVTWYLTNEGWVSVTHVK